MFVLAIGIAPVDWNLRPVMVVKAPSINFLFVTLYQLMSLVVPDHRARADKNYN
jgi:hypothetical protein